MTGPLPDRRVVVTALGVLAGLALTNVVLACALKLSISGKAARNART